jgi:hypothetical protein
MKAPPYQLHRSAFAEENKMRILILICSVVVSGLAVSAQRPGTPDDSLLRPAHPAYADATEFARFLNARNITVKSIHNSKLSGFFWGLPKAALLRTDKGILEVIFFPDNGAEKVSVTERRDNKRYIYSFRGQPQPNPPKDSMNAAYPVYFITHGSWFVVAYSEETATAVKSAFSRS